MKFRKAQQVILWWYRFDSVLCDRGTRRLLERFEHNGDAERMMMMMGSECGYGSRKRHGEGKAMDGRSQHQLGDAKGMPWCDAQPVAQCDDCRSLTASIRIREA